MKAHITPTVMDGIVVRWLVDPDNHRRGEISASREAVMTSGSFTLRTQIDREHFEAALRAAWEVYRRLAKAAERGPFVRMSVEDVRALLVELGVEVVEGKGFGAR